jgi:hypothetical protein
MTGLHGMTIIYLVRYQMMRYARSQMTNLIPGRGKPDWWQTVAVTWFLRTVGTYQIPAMM